MNLHDAIQWSTLGPDLVRLMPEVWLIIAMCAVILAPVVGGDRVRLPTIMAMLGLLLALGATLATLRGPAVPGGSAFHGMLVVDPFSQYFKILLIVFTMFVIVQWIIASRDKTSPLDVPDYLCLLLGATVGMALMASATNLVMIFIAMETASLPSYALAGFRRRNRAGSEGSLKYVLIGSAASAVMLYGMSLIYGATGSLDLSTIAAHAAGLPVLGSILQGSSPDVAATAGTVSPILAVGLLAMFAGIAFKLSAVPMHFWCPDVFEAAPVDVTTFLSVASKGAAVCLLLRILEAFGVAAGQVQQELASALANEKFASVHAALLNFHPTQFTGLMVAVGGMGAVTATWGNLVALRQTNIRRLLAYSSIAHAGYMIMAASVIVAAAGSLEIEPHQVSGAILFYLTVYLFMNLGAFTVAALVARATGQEDIREYTGLIKRSPALAVLMVVFLLSLFGMPALGGFMGKIYLMSKMFAAGVAGFALIAVLLVNTLLSLYFYMRPVYYMVLVPDKESRPAFRPGIPAFAVLALCVVMLFWTGIFPNFLADTTQDMGRMAGSSQTSAAAASSAAAPVAPPGPAAQSLAR